ncbi:MAG: hypothetical protein L6Q99_07585 [Planctomycetes bacterium]|nr:hypothetical protein [Planctomycetota bacterium]
MRRWLLRGFTLVAIGLWCAPAGAHGGVFPPVPPAPPAPPRQAPPTPGPPNGPATPPSKPSGPKTPSPTTPAGPWTPGPSTPKPAVAPTTGEWDGDLASWRVWWRFNQDEFLELKARLGRKAPVTGSEGFFGDAESAAIDHQRAATSDVLERIVPALLVSLRRDGGTDVTTAALIALARVGERSTTDGSTPHAAALSPLLRHPNQEIAETAALAFGILGANSPRNVDLLSRFVSDDRAGLASLHGLEFAKPISDRSRCFGLFGLGLLGEGCADPYLRRSIVATLEHELDRGLSEASADTAVAALTALGLVALDSRASRAANSTGEASGARSDIPSRSVEEQLAKLFAVYVDERVQDLVRAHVPIALARLLERRASGPWRERIMRRLIADLSPNARASGLLQRSAVQALGRLATAAPDELDVEARAALLGALEARDQFVRRFACIALAHAGSHAAADHDAGAAEADDEGDEVDQAGKEARVVAAANAADEVRSRLIQGLEADKAGASSWAALSLGVLEHRLRRDGASVPERTVKALLAARKRARTSEDRGACTLALGLIGDPVAAEVLRDAFADERNPETQGDLALALGLVGDATAIDAIRELLSRSRYQPSLLISAATGLGLLGDVRLVPSLVDLLSRSTTQASQGAVAAALGRIGDVRSIEPLVELAARADVTDGARAFATVALGMVGDRRPLPWRMSLARDLNYTAGTPSLMTPENASGVLDIL